MASTYSLVLLLLGMMMVTTVVGAGRSNMFGYPDQYPLLDPEDWVDLISETSDIRVGGKRVPIVLPPPIYDREEDLYDFDLLH